MWKLFFVMTLPLASLAAAHSVEPGADVQCQIRANPVSGGVELEGIVSSETPLVGTYQFDVRKAGSAGTSNSAQSGDFEARPGEEVVGQVGLGLEHGATYEAELVVKWKDGKASCQATGPDGA